MTRLCASIVLLAPLLMLTACQSFMRRDSDESPGAAATVRDQGYALLYSTIDDESRLEQVLIIKDPDPQVAELIKAIAQFSRDAKSSLQTFAEVDATLDLDNEGLPEVETLTRDAISGATSKQILFSGGKKFEFRILLTQHQALNYITHLAAALSEQDTRDERKRYLSKLAADSDALHERVITLLESPYVGQPK